MDTQVATTLITGCFGAIVTPIVNHYFAKNPRKRHPALSAGIGGLAGVLLGYFVVSQIPVFFPVGRIAVNITSPAPEASVPRLVTVQGTARQIPEGKELWLLVVPEGVAAYFPQTGPVVVSRDGNWSTSAYLGLDSPDDIGRGFMLVAALADKQGSTSIRAYFARSERDFKGMEPLPQGLQLLDQVRIVRK